MFIGLYDLLKRFTQVSMVITFMFMKHIYINTIFQCENYSHLHVHVITRAVERQQPERLASNEPPSPTKIQNIF